MQKKSTIVMLTSMLVVAGSGGVVRADVGTEADSGGRVLEEILVTAEKRTENIQQIPISITALSSETLSQRGIGGLNTLQQAVPSLQFTNEEGSFANITIRGVGNSLLGLDIEPAVAVIQDGVTYASQWVNLADFFDVDGVQVLRGPQGTISGRNATGGAILVQSKLPTQNAESAFTATYGNYNMVGMEGYFSGPILGDRVFGRIAVRTLRSDGWVYNSLLGQDLGGFDKIDARATVLAHVTDTLQATLTLQAIHDRTSFFLVDAGRVRPDKPSLSELNGTPAFDPHTDTLQQNLVSDTNIQKNQTGLKLDWDIRPSMRLTSVSAYVNSHVQDATDLDATAAPAFQTVARVPYTRVSQASQELTLTADVTDHIDMIVGALYLRQNINNINEFGAPLIGIPEKALYYDQTIILNSRGVYTQWRYKFTDKFRVTAGVRRVSDSKYQEQRSITFGQYADQPSAGSWNGWTPRFALDYEVNKDLNLYISASKGFKSGGFNSISTPITTFGPESVWSYEAGLKGTFLSGRLKTTLDAFYMNYNNMQESVLGLDERSAFSAQVINVPSAKIKGVELEVDALVSDHVRLGFGGVWLDSRYGNFSSSDSLYPELGAPGPTGLNLRQVSGNELVNAPRYQFNASAEYRQPLTAGTTGAVRASYTWQDHIYFDIFSNPGMSQSSYGLVNFSGDIKTTDGHWEVSAVASNVANKFYVNGRNTQPFAPTAYAVSMPGQPRRYSLSVTRHF